MTSIIFIILSQNEMLNIGRAIRSIKGLGKVLVVDSGSTDGTQDVARELGAEVVYRQWTGFANQRNCALSLATGYEFAFFLDADEALDRELWTALELEDFGAEVDGFWVRRRNYFQGKELRHVGRYPDRQLRFFRVGAATFESREVHERAVVSGKTSQIAGHLLHDSSLSLHGMLAKHQVYADLEAQALKREGWAGLRLPRSRQDLRRAFKQLVWLRLPCRGLLRIWWLLVIKRGFLDGRAGYAYVKMLAAYECQIDCFRYSLASSASGVSAQVGMSEHAH